MKLLICFAALLISLDLTFSQQVIFNDRSDRLNSITGFATFSDCAVDMNGDYLDDVVRIGEKGIFIDFQKHDGTFEQKQFNISVQSPPSWSICAGDLNNDHFNDLLLAGSSSVSFVLAIDGASGYMEMIMPDTIESQRSTLADINADGWLDGFVCGETGISMPYRNTGDGIMIPDTNFLLTSNLVGNYAAIWVDYDNDQDIDLYISKCWEGALPGDSVRTNLLYRNNGDGTFDEVAAQAGINDNAQSWSTAFEDFDNDGDMDAFVLNHDFANRLYQNNGDGTFTDVIAGSGIDPFDLVGLEAQAGDFNNDGYMDLFTDLAVGLYLGNGDMTFMAQEIPPKPGGKGDFNNDGFLDIIQDNQLWINEPNANHWVKVNLLGIESNQNGIGARIELFGPWGIKIREARSGEGYSPMNSLTTHFGLGISEEIDSLIVKWPSGIITKLNDIQPDTTYIIPEVTCIGDPVTITIPQPVQLCPGQSYTVAGPDGFASYLWTNGDTGRVTVLSENGFYYLIANDSMGCTSISNSVEVQIVADEIPVIFASGTTRFCEGDTLTLTSSQGANYLWSSGEIQQSIQVGESGIYSVAIDGQCSGDQLWSEPVVVTVLSAPPPVPSTVYIFPGDSVLLMASGENIHWYDEISGGNLLATGSTYQTEVLSSSITYYLESHSLYPEVMQSGGKVDTSGPGGLPQQNGALIFQNYEPFILNTVTVYVPQGGPAGIRFIQLWSGDSLLITKSFNVQEGANVLDLDFFVSAGEHLLTTPQGNLYRNEGGINYPYALGDAGQILNSSNGPDYYYYFYDWKITKPEITCISERVPFQVIVTSMEAPEEHGLNIFPNPASDKLFFKVSSSYAFEITLFSPSGKMLHTIHANSGTSVMDISSYSRGIYFIQARGEEGVVLRKIILN